MSSTIVFLLFIPLVTFILLTINLIFAPRNPYIEKNNVFECGFTSFLGQNRTQFSISFFIFALLFLLFDLEILLVYPYLVSAYVNEIYGLTILLVFLLALTLGFVFELGKKALTIDSRQTNYKKKKVMSNYVSETHNGVNYVHNSVIIQSSFTNYKVFNKGFWSTYLSTLKTKFTRKNIIFTLLVITFSYCFKNYLQLLLDLDLSKFIHFTFIMVVSNAFCKAILHLLELVNNPSELDKMHMGGDNRTITTLEKSKQIGNVFAMNNPNDENNSIENNPNDDNNSTESNVSHTLNNTESNPTSDAESSVTNRNQSGTTDNSTESDEAREKRETVNELNSFVSETISNSTASKWSEKTEEAINKLEDKIDAINDEIVRIDDQYFSHSRPNVPESRLTALELHQLDYFGATMEVPMRNHLEKLERRGGTTIDIKESLDDIYLELVEKEEKEEKEEREEREKRD